MELKQKALFNASGDTDVRMRRMINGNTTNLNDFNNMKYQWVSDWYRQAMNNFWIPEEINLTQDMKDYRLLKFFPFWFSWILYKPRIFLMWENILQLMKLICV